MLIIDNTLLMSLFDPNSIDSEMISARCIMRPIMQNFWSQCVKEPRAKAISMEND